MGRRVPRQGKGHGLNELAHAQVRHLRHLHPRRAARGGRRVRRQRLGPAEVLGEQVPVLSWDQGTVPVQVRTLGRPWASCGTHSGRGPAHRRALCGRTSCGPVSATWAGVPVRHVFVPSLRLGRGVGEAALLDVHRSYIGRAPADRSFGGAACRPSQQVSGKKPRGLLRFRTAPGRDGALSPTQHRAEESAQLWVGDPEQPGHLGLRESLLRCRGAHPQELRARRALGFIPAARARSLGGRAVAVVQFASG